MKRIVCFFLTAALLLCLAVPVTAARLPYTDVAADSWYLGGVTYAYENGLMTGTTPSTFSPDQATTRAMLVVTLYRLAGKPAVSGGNPFADVAPDRYYTNAVIWAAENHIANGYTADRFGPEDPVTREQMAVIFYRYARAQGRDFRASILLDTFPDAKSVSSWAREAFQWCVATGLLSGVARQKQAWLEPQGHATRAQIATVLQRFGTSADPEPLLTIGYIPLDNRAVNDLRPVWQMEGAGIRVLMPEEDLYATRLDNQSPNANGTTYGDREALLAWLQTNQAQCDIIILSLDQMLSGGLVSSRAMNHTDLTFEYAVIDYIAQLSREKPVYVFDTVMRLASTIHYQGLGADAYNNFRAYGMQPRSPLTGEALTLENIYQGYRFDANGQPVRTTLDEAALQSYHDARIRKLRLADRMLQQSQDLAALFIGVDDSCPGNSIQSNELAYLKARLGSNACLFCGTDELGMMAVSRAYTDFCGTKLRLQVTYFGGGEDFYADQFDTTTLRNAVSQHITALGAREVTENADIQVLALTRNCTQAAADQWMQTWCANNAAGIPTIVIDSSTSDVTFPSLLAALPVDSLLGYSCWGTSGNAVGIALAGGITRAAALQNSAAAQPLWTRHFAEGLVFALVKDIAYCRNVRNTLSDLSPAGIETQLLASDAAQRILTGLPGHRLMMNWEGTASYQIPQIQLTDFSAPFARTYEIDFSVNLAP